MANGPNALAVAAQQAANNQQNQGGGNRQGQQNRGGNNRNNQGGQGGGQRLQPQRDILQVEVTPPAEIKGSQLALLRIKVMIRDGNARRVPNAKFYVALDDIWQEADATFAARAYNVVDNCFATNQSGDAMVEFTIPLGGESQTGKVKVEVLFMTPSDIEYRKVESHPVPFATPQTPSVPTKISKIHVSYADVTGQPTHRTALVCFAVTDQHGKPAQGAPVSGLFMGRRVTATATTHGEYEMNFTLTGLNQKSMLLVSMPNGEHQTIELEGKPSVTPAKATRLEVHTHDRHTPADNSSTEHSIFFVALNADGTPVPDASVTIELEGSHTQSYTSDSGGKVELLHTVKAGAKVKCKSYLSGGTSKELELEGPQAKEKHPRLSVEPAAAELESTDIFENKYVVTLNTNGPDGKAGPAVVWVAASGGTITLQDETGATLATDVSRHDWTTTSSTTNITITFPGFGERTVKFGSENSADVVSKKLKKNLD